MKSVIWIQFIKVVHIFETYVASFDTTREHFRNKIWNSGLKTLFKFFNLFGFKLFCCFGAQLKLRWPKGYDIKKIIAELNSFNFLNEFISFGKFFYFKMLILQKVMGM